MKLIRHIADVVDKESVLSLEFRSSANCRSLSLCFLEGKNLVTQCSRDNLVVKGNVSRVVQLLGVVSTGPTIVCCESADIDFIKTLDRHPTRKAGVHYFFTLSSTQVETLMQKPSFSVMGKIDMLSMLRTLLVRLSGKLDEPWLQSTRFLRKVRSNATKFSNFVVMSFELSKSCVFKVLQDASLDMHAVGPKLCHILG